VGRIVGLDVGERRIGVAVSDLTATLARPLTVVHTTGLDGDAVHQVVQALTRLSADDDGLSSIVVGLPRHLDGSASAMTPRVEAFAARLQARMSLPVALQDERLTSVEADARLAARGAGWRARRQQVDAEAAAIILQDYLDAHAGPWQPQESDVH